MFVLEVCLRRVGGVIYQVFIEVVLDRRFFFGIRWFVEYVRERKDKRIMKEKFAVEIMDAVNNIGGVVKKKEDIYRMVEVNRVFVYYRW